MLAHLPDVCLGALGIRGKLAHARLRSKGWMLQSLLLATSLCTVRQQE